MSIPFFLFENDQPVGDHLTTVTILTLGPAVGKVPGFAGNCSHSRYHPSLFLNKAALKSLLILWLRYELI